MLKPQLTQYELRFQSLFDSGRAFSFPCDPQGHVDLDQLSETARANYLYARAVVGRELAVPAVRPGGRPADADIGRPAPNAVASRHGTE